MRPSNRSTIWAGTRGEDSCPSNSFFASSEISVLRATKATSRARLSALSSHNGTLHAYDAWQYREWDTVERDYAIIHQLAPGDIDAWITGACSPPAR